MYIILRCKNRKCISRHWNTLSNNLGSISLKLDNITSKTHHWRSTWDDRLRRRDVVVNGYSLFGALCLRGILAHPLGHLLLPHSQRKLFILVHGFPASSSCGGGSVRCWRRRCLTNGHAVPPVYGSWWPVQDKVQGNWKNDIYHLKRETAYLFLQDKNKSLYSII